jgi:3-oxoadipate enol-lactonase
MGGVIAQRFAIDFPEQTRALVLISTSSEVGPAARDAWQARAALVEREGLAAALTSGPALSYSQAYREQQAEAIEIATRSTVASNDPRSYAAACRAVAAYSFTAELRTISCPTLILQGLSDELTPPGGSVIMARAIPNAQIEFIADCGHAIPTEQPSLTVQHLDAFLQALPPAK